MTAFCSSGHSGDPAQGGSGLKINRRPYAAGKFYTADSAALQSEIKELFQAALPKKYDNVFALISPHAGYVYSGEVAATAFNQIDTAKQYDHVFVIGSSHHDYFDGGSIYNIGDYITPLGAVTVDTAFAGKLVRENAVFRFSPNFHEQEHSLEVQLPFLQYKLGKKISLIPILIGTDGPETCMKIARALKPYMTEGNLFVVSSDFSHYPGYADAVITDKKTSDAIVSNDPGRLLKTLQANEDSKTPGLATSLCGYTSVLSMLYMTARDTAVRVHEVEYKNSGDSRFGEKDRVVGYQAIVFEGKLHKKEVHTDFGFSEPDREKLLKVARKTLEAYFSQGKAPELNEAEFSAALKTPAGAFVTLKKNGRLRGCIGRFTSDEPLYLVIRQMAIAAATEDSRFSPVTSAELPRLEIEISVLSPMRKISSPSEIVLGKHGIYIRKGMRSGTFLPQVATETGWSRDEFLGHCSEDKAGLGWEGWKDAELYVYEAVVFGEKE